MSSITTRAGKGSELSHTELDDNFTNLNTDKIENINSESLSDLTDVNATTPTDGQALAYDNATSKWTAQTIAGSGTNTFGTIAVAGQSDVVADSTTDTLTLTAGSNITLTTDASTDTVTIASTASGGDVVDDTTPQLGGDLDVQNRAIVTTSIGNQIKLGSTNNENLVFEGDSKSQNVLLLEPNFYTTDTGKPEAKITTNAHNLDHTGTTATFNLLAEAVTGYPGRFNVMVGGVSMLRADTVDGVVFSNSMTFPSADGTADQVLKTDGAGNLSWTTAASGGGASTNWLTANNGIDFATAPSAIPANSIALGNSAVASDDDTVCIGRSTASSSNNLGVGAVVIGMQASSSGASVDEGAVVIGAYASTLNKGSVTIGMSAKSWMREATSIGPNADAFGAKGIAIGYNSQQKGTIGSSCYETVIGDSARTYNQQSTALGARAMILSQGAAQVGYDNCTGVGYEAFVSAANQVQLGDSRTTTYAYGAVQARSDERDKTEIVDTTLGLDFINAIRPVDFKWDYRENYFDTIVGEDGEVSAVHNARDGSKKGTRKHHGVIAQEVKQVIDNMGVDFGGYQDHNINGGEDVKSVGYTEFIAPLIKAVQELTAKCDDLQAQLNNLP